MSTPLRFVVESPAVKARSSEQVLTLDRIDAGTGRLLPRAEAEVWPGVDHEGVAFEPGDVLVSRLRPYLAKAIRADAAGVASTELLVLRPHSSRLDSRFLHYLTLSSAFTGWASATAYGSKMPRTSREALGQVQVPELELAVQRRIADYLDTETARIDQVQARAERARELIEERFLSTVVDAVTHGVATRGIGAYGSAYWIGSIPDTWSVVPLGLRYRVQLGKMLNEERTRTGQQRPYLGNSDVRWDGFDLDNLKSMSFSDDEWDRYGVEPGDILVCEGGEVGRAAVWRGGPTGIHFQKALHRLRPLNPGLEEPRYLMYALMAAARTGVFAAGSSKATIDHLTGEKLAEHRFPFPPRREQAAVAADLDELAEASARLKAALEAQQRLLAERRQAVVTAAVTGELEV